MAAQLTSPAPRLAVESFFDSRTSTISYIVFDEDSRQCAIIDSVLDYEPSSGRTSTASADTLLARVEALSLSVAWILETHVHADHLSAASYLQTRVGGKSAIGEQISVVQEVFGGLFNAEPGFARDGSQFDRLLADGDRLQIGGLEVSVLSTPGHTPACVTYVVSDGRQRAAFVGDTLFMPDYGTARCDFPGGDAHTLYRSIQRIFGLPLDTVLYMCHDYQPGGRSPRFSSTVEEQRRENLHVRDGIAENDFISMRTQRDATLGMPALLLPSVQINMRAGRLPEPEGNGVTYLKIPLNAV